MSSITQYYRAIGNIWDTLYSKHQLRDSDISWTESMQCSEFLIELKPNEEQEKITQIVIGNSADSGAPLTRKEVYPGKNPENLFFVELFEAWAWKRTWETWGWTGILFLWCTHRYRAPLACALAQGNPPCTSLPSVPVCFSCSVSAACCERSRPVSFCLLAAHMLCFNFRLAAPKSLLGLFGLLGVFLSN